MKRRTAPIFILAENSRRRHQRRRGASAPRGGASPGRRQGRRNPSAASCPRPAAVPSLPHDLGFQSSSAAASPAHRRARGCPRVGIGPAPGGGKRVGLPCIGPVRRALRGQFTATRSPFALNKASREAHETLDGGVLSPRGLMLLGRTGAGSGGRGGYRVKWRCNPSRWKRPARAFPFSTQAMSRGRRSMTRHGTSTPTGWCSISPRTIRFQWRAGPDGRHGHGDLAGRKGLARDDKRRRGSHRPCAPERGRGLGRQRRRPRGSPAALVCNRCAAP